MCWRKVETRTSRTRAKTPGNAAKETSCCRSNRQALSPAFWTFWSRIYALFDQKELLDYQRKSRCEKSFEVVVLAIGKDRLRLELRRRLTFLLRESHMINPRSLSWASIVLVRFGSREPEVKSSDMGSSMHVWLPEPYTWKSPRVWMANRLLTP